MGKIRTVKDTNYSVISNAILWDKRLSPKARFILIFCLSLADSWEYNVIGLASSIGISSDAIVKGLKELELYGYLERKQLFDERKKFAGYDYMFYEKSKVDGHSDLPYTEKPYTENTYTEKPPQLNTNKLNTKELNTNSIITSQDGKDAVAAYMQHIHPTPSSTMVEKINDLANEVGADIFIKACDEAERYNKRSLAYVEAVALDMKNGSGRKPNQPIEDYWAYMLKGVEDGDKQN